MTRHAPYVLPLLLTGLIALPVHAAPKLKPGLWEITQTTDGSSDVEESCLSVDDARDTTSFRKRISGDCTLSNIRDTNKVYAFDYRCESKTQSGNGVFELNAESPTRYNMRYTLSGSVQAGDKRMPVSFDLTAKARWLAEDCGEFDEDASYEDGDYEE